MENNKKVTVLLLTVIALLFISLILFVVIINVNLLDTSNTAKPTPTKAPALVERELFQTMENRGKQLLFNKHRWDKGGYRLDEKYVDSKHYVAVISSTNENIKSGSVLFSINNSWELLFDPTVPNPCSLLTGEKEYLKLIIDECRTQ